MARHQGLGGRRPRRCPQQRVPSFGLDRRPGRHRFPAVRGSRRRQQRRRRTQYRQRDHHPGRPGRPGLRSLHPTGHHLLPSQRPASQRHQRGDQRSHPGPTGLLGLHPTRPRHRRQRHRQLQQPLPERKRPHRRSEPLPRHVPIRLAPAQPAARLRPQAE